MRPLRKSWRTAAPGCILQARAPAPQFIDLFREPLVKERIFAEVSLFQNLRFTQNVILSAAKNLEVISIPFFVILNEVKDLELVEKTRFFAAHRMTKP
jgi:hypothetical protein